MEASPTKKLLIHFIKKFQYLDFCLNEFESLVSMSCPPAASIMGRKYPCMATLREALYCHPRESLNVHKHPFAYVNLPGGEASARELVKRSILIKEVIDVISEAKTY